MDFLKKGVYVWEVVIRHSDRILFLSASACEIGLLRFPGPAALPRGAASAIPDSENCCKNSFAGLKPFLRDKFHFSPTLLLSNLTSSFLI